MLLFTAALGGAILGFLFFNFNPASIFMGDTGSMFLGFVLATASIQTHLKASTAASLIVAVVALGIPILDTLLAVARRAARGAPLFSADRGHIHHKLLALGLSQRQAVLLIYAAAVVLGGTALALTRATAFQALAILVGLALATALVLRRLGYLRPEDVRRLLHERRRNLELRDGLRHVAQRLRRATRAADVWESVKDAASRLGARGVALELGSASESGSMHFGCSIDAAPPGPPGHLRSRHSLLGERRDSSHIDFAWDHGRESIDRDTEIAVELLCMHVKDAVKRIDLSRETLGTSDQYADPRRTGTGRSRHRSRVVEQSD